MGFFDLKAICGICNREVGYNRYKIKKSDAWICPKCLKRAGGLSKVNVSKITVEEIRDILSQKDMEQEKRKMIIDKNPLATAEGMYKYCVDNNYDSGWNEEWGIKHFKIIENNLMEDEIVELVFIGLHNYVSATKNDGNFAYAITNKRIMMVQKSAIVGEKFQTVLLDNINYITYNSGIALATITIDSVKEIFNVGLSKVVAQQLNNKIHELIGKLKYKSQSNSVLESKIEISVADEIKKYKELLDMGALTQEEFDIKKKQLLNL